MHNPILPSHLPSLARDGTVVEMVPSELHGVYAYSEALDGIELGFRG